MEELLDLINSVDFRNEFYQADKEEQLKLIAEVMYALSDLAKD